MCLRILLNRSLIVKVVSFVVLVLLLASIIGISLTIVFTRKIESRIPRASLTITGINIGHYKSDPEFYLGCIYANSSVLTVPLCNDGECFTSPDFPSGRNLTEVRLAMERQFPVFTILENKWSDGQKCWLTNPNETVPKYILYIFISSLVVSTLMFSGICAYLLSHKNEREGMILIPDG